MSSEERKNSRSFSVTRKTIFITVALILVAGLTIGVLSGALNVTQIFQGEEIVATVNGEEITMDEFARVLEQQKMQYLIQGIDLDSKEMSDMLKELEQHVLESYFIIPVLLQQKAAEEIVVSEDEIEERYREYVDAFGGEAQLAEQMEAANLSRAELDEEITRELSIGNYLDSYLAEYLADHPGERIDENVAFSRDEIEERYHQLRESYAQLKELLKEDDPEMPREQLELQFLQLEEQYGELLAEDDFEAIKPQLAYEMRREIVEHQRQEKEQRIIIAHIEELLEKSEIKKYI